MWATLHRCRWISGGHAPVFGLGAGRKQEGRPTRYAMRRTTVGLSPFTYFPCRLLTSKTCQDTYHPLTPHRKHRSPTTSTPTPASMVPATQPLASVCMRLKHPTQGYTAQCGLKHNGDTTPSWLAHHHPLKMLAEPSHAGLTSATTSISHWHWWPARTWPWARVTMWEQTRMMHTGIPTLVIMMC